MHGVVNEEVVAGFGVLRDEAGVARALFSGPIAAKDVDFAEVCAIMVALDMYSGMG